MPHKHHQTASNNMVRGKHGGHGDAKSRYAGRGAARGDAGVRRVGGGARAARADRADGPRRRVAGRCSDRGRRDRRRGPRRGLAAVGALLATVCVVVRAAGASWRAASGWSTGAPRRSCARRWCSPSGRVSGSAWRPVHRLSHPSRRRRRRPPPSRSTRRARRPRVGGDDRHPDPRAAGDPRDRGNPDPASHRPTCRRPPQRPRQPPPGRRIARPGVAPPRRRRRPLPRRGGRRRPPPTIP